MIAAVEGQVGAGKTTLTALLGRHALALQEYPHLDQAADDDQWTVQLRYLEAERARRRRVDAALTVDTTTPVVLDRSVVSQVAHVHALAELGGVDNRSAMTDHLLGAPATIVVPDLVVQLQPSSAVRRAQLTQRESGDGRLGTAAIFADHAYERAHDEFTRRLTDRLAGTGRIVPLTGFPLGDTGWAAQFLAVLVARAHSAQSSTGILDVLVSLLDSGRTSS